MREMFMKSTLGSILNVDQFFKFMQAANAACYMPSNAFI
jgi:hypothetical protein